MTPAAGQRYAPRLLLMVKEPVAGRVKTRLAREIGVAAATRFMRANLQHTIARLSGDARWHTLLCVSPDAALASRILPCGPDRLAQGTGDIGQRMARAACDAPPGPVVIIGADIPGVTREDIARAFRALGSADAVFGPADDGGYWLVGLAPHMRTFDMYANVRWSGPHALADTRANLTGKRVREVTFKHDVDDAAGFAQVGALAGRRIVPCGHAQDLPRRCSSSRGMISTKLHGL